MKNNDKSLIKNSLLYQKAKLLEKYAINMPNKVDNFGIQLDNPEYGWIDFHIIINDEEKELINFSEVYEPFEDIREWLENIVIHIFDFTPCGVNIYDEFYNYILYYEPIVFQTDELLASPQLYGIFYVYDGHEDKIVADALCETREFVRNFYQTIKHYAQESLKNKSFVEDWIEGAYNNEWGEMDDGDPRIQEIFMNKVLSEKIESFLSNDQSTTRFVCIK